jgi:hypothetical protein
MRKLVLILIASIAVVTFIRAFDNSGNLAQNTGISETIVDFHSER